MSALTWAGDEGAVVYSLSAQPGWTIMLARFDARGLGVGVPVQLGNSLAAPVPGPTLAVAGDGTQYLACWDGTTAEKAGFACAVVSVGSGPAVAGYSGTGYAPSAANGVGGLLVLTRAATGPGLDFQRLTSAGQPVAYHGSTVADSAGRAVALGDGYLLSYVNAVEQLDTLLLDANGGITTDPSVSLASAFGLSAGPPPAVAAVGNSAAVVWSLDTGSPGIYAAVRSGATAGAAVLLSSAVPNDGQVSVAAGDHSFAATWSDPSGQIMYLPLDMAGAATGAPVAAHSTASNGAALALTAVPDGFMLASADGTPAAAIQLVHLTCQ